MYWIILLLAMIVMLLYALIKTLTEGLQRTNTLLEELRDIALSTEEDHNDNA